MEGLIPFRKVAFVGDYVPRKCGIFGGLAGNYLLATLNVARLYAGSFERARQQRQGAESTLAFLLSLSEMRLAQHALLAIQPEKTT